jgi:iron only hydrogenase large subunit-like protein
VLRSDEIIIVSGINNLESAVEEFKNNPKIRFIDALFCEGGCINGPGIVSNLSTEGRKDKVLKYASITK